MNVPILLVIVEVGLGMGPLTPPLAWLWRVIALFSSVCRMENVLVGISLVDITKATKLLAQLQNAKSVRRPGTGCER